MTADAPVVHDDAWRYAHGVGPQPSGYTPPEPVPSRPERPES